MFQKLLLLLSTLFLLFSCGQQAEPAAPSASKAVISEEKLPPVEAPGLDEGIITYISGDVLIREKDDWFYADIGDPIDISHSIKVESGSFCEVQFGDTAIIQIQAGTEISLARLNTGSENKVGIDLVSGSILSKVQKLTQADTFEIRTQAAVCGVRGTEFKVSVDDSGAMNLSVKEGAVAIRPPKTEFEDIKSAAAEEIILEQIVKDIEESLPVVTENKEITIKADQFAQTEEALKNVAKSAANLATADKASREELVESVRQQAQEIRDVAAREVAKEIVQISRENKANLDKNMQAMQLVEIPEEGEKLVRLVIHVIPGGASIKEAGRELASTRLSSLYPENTTRQFIIEKDGYETQTLDVNVESGKSVTVRLQKQEENPTDNTAAPDETSAIENNQTPENNNSPASENAQKPDEDKPDTPENDNATANAANAAVENNADNAAGADTANVAAGKPEQPQVEEPKLYTVKIKTNIGTISINGEQVAGTSFQGDFEENQLLAVKVWEEGHTTHQETITVSSGGANNYNIRLEKQPVELTTHLSDSPLIRKISGRGNMSYAVNQNGTIYAFDLAGNISWKYESGNVSKEAGELIVEAGRVFYSGNKNFVILNGLNGNEILRKELSTSERATLGRHVAASSNYCVFPTEEGISIYNPVSGELLNTVAFNRGTQASPVLQDDFAFVVNKDDTLFKIDLKTAEIAAQGPSGVFQALTSAPLLDKGILYLIGRKGSVSAVDAQTLSIKWKVEQQATNDQGFFNTPTSNDSLLFIKDRTNLYAINKSNGKVAYALKNVLSQPVMAGKYLIFGSGSDLILAEPQNGRTVHRIPTGSNITTQAEVKNNRIIVGNTGGDVTIINLRGVD